MNCIFGRWNEYNVYPESANNKSEFENVSFKEMGSTRLLYKIIIPDM